jgi:hypothetical protein
VTKSKKPHACTHSKKQETLSANGVCPRLTQSSERSGTPEARTQRMQASKQENMVRVLACIPCFLHFFYTDRVCSTSHTEDGPAPGMSLVLLCMLFNFCPHRLLTPRSEAGVGGERRSRRRGAVRRCFGGSKPLHLQAQNDGVRQSPPQLGRKGCELVRRARKRPRSCAWAGVSNMKGERPCAKAPAHE